MLQIMDILSTNVNYYTHRLLQKKEKWPV